MLKVLDLFSGIGGFSLGLERAGMKTVAFCEIDPFCRRVLKKHWPDVPIYEDVRELRGEDVGPVDVICGGYPCQPFSVAGNRKGAEDDRHLWPEFSRLVDEIRPAWVIGENVAGHINMGLDDVLSDMEGKGYTARTFVIPACAVDAPHRRDRVWIVANTNSSDDSRSAGENESPSPQKRIPQRDEHRFSGFSSEVCAEDMANASSRRRGKPSGGEGKQSGRTETERTGENVADTPRELRDGRGTIRREARGAEHSDGCRWPVEPPVGRVVNGLPGRVDRLRGLGNAVVPQIPEIIGRAIIDAGS